MTRGWPSLRIVRCRVTWGTVVRREGLSEPVGVPPARGFGKVSSFLSPALLLWGRRGYGAYLARVVHGTGGSDVGGVGKGFGWWMRPGRHGYVVFESLV